MKFKKLKDKIQLLIKISIFTLKNKPHFTKNSNPNYLMSI